MRLDGFPRVAQGDHELKGSITRHSLDDEAGERAARRAARGAIPVW